jgi:hypothetical protein
MLDVWKPYPEIFGEDGPIHIIALAFVHKSFRWSDRVQLVGRYLPRAIFEHRILLGRTMRNVDHHVIHSVLGSSRCRWLQQDFSGIPANRYRRRKEERRKGRSL